MTPAAITTAVNARYDQFLNWLAVLKASKCCKGRKPLPTVSVPPSAVLPDSLQAFSDWAAVHMLPSPVSSTEVTTEANAFPLEAAVLQLDEFAVPQAAGVCVCGSHRNLLWNYVVWLFCFVF